MKKKKRVVAPSSLPTRISLWPTIVIYLLLEKLQATGVVQGIVYTLLALWWIGAFASMYHEERRDAPGFGDL